MPSLSDPPYSPISRESPVPHASASTCCALPFVPHCACFVLTCSATLPLGHFPVLITLNPALDGRRVGHNTACGFWHFAPSRLLPRLLCRLRLLSVCCCCCAFCAYLRGFRRLVLGAHSGASSFSAAPFHYSPATTALCSSLMATGWTVPDLCVVLIRTPVLYPAKAAYQQNIAIIMDCTSWTLYCTGL